MFAGGLRVARLIAGADDHADLLDAGRERLFHEDSEDGFFLTIAVDERLATVEAALP